jgi:predicted TPR repeat methyltransferase
MIPIDKNFWENKHTNADRWWLTGTQFDSLLEFHDLSQEDIKNKKVLEIGVGLGICTQTLYKLADELFCADISEVALERVKPFSKLQYHTNDIKLIPSVDIAVCHLVFQHCTDLEITRIINDVNLTDAGIFSFQFASLKDNIITPTMQDLINKGSHFFRSVDTVKKIIDQTNKELIYISEPTWWGGKNNHEWYISKVRNKK